MERSDGRGRRTDAPMVAVGPPAGAERLLVGRAMAVLTGAAALTFVLGPVEPAAAQQAIPVVRIAPGPAVSTAVSGGPCYPASVPVTQPNHFVVARTGDLSGPLTVSVLEQVAYAQPATPQQVRIVEVPAGSDRVTVPLIAVRGRPTLQMAEWVSTVQSSGDGSYTVDHGGTRAVATGHVGADGTGGPCPLRDRTVHLAVEVGEPVVDPDQARSPTGVDQFTFLDGAMPDGMLVNNREGLAGAPWAPGDHTVRVTQCPYPVIEHSTCATITYQLAIRPQGAPPPGGPPATRPDAPVDRGSVGTPQPIAGAPSDRGGDPEAPATTVADHDAPSPEQAGAAASGESAASTADSRTSRDGHRPDRDHRSRDAVVLASEGGGRSSGLLGVAVVALPLAGLAAWWARRSLVRRG